MDEGAACATVTFAEAVVIHAVLLLLLFLASVSDDGDAPLDRAAVEMQTKPQISTVSFDVSGNFRGETLQGGFGFSSDPRASF